MADTLCPERFARHGDPPGEPLQLPVIPPKTTFGGKHTAERRRITAYLEQIAPLTDPWRSAPLDGLAMVLEVGLPPGADLLRHHDLDNFIEPLASHLGRGRLALARATKAAGRDSRLRLGSVSQSAAPLHDWSFASGGTGSLDAAGRRTLGRAIAARSEPLPWGPVEMEIAVRVGPGREWINAWKPIIDSLVAILGRIRGRAEFDIEDGRIVALGLHREMDPALGHDVEVGVWWRPCDLPASPVAPPELDYAVLERLLEAPSGNAGRAATAAPQDVCGSESGMALILDLDRLHAVQAARQGYVVITDSASPPRVHRAGCREIKDAYFETKVIRNRMRNGQYIAAASLEHVRWRWPGRGEHSCV